jgi:soluble lytic murein transglycosylase-like protein
MAISDLPDYAARRQRPRQQPRQESRQRSSGTLALALVAMLAVAAIAIAFIAYVLWPRWPGPPIGPDAPALPITIAGTAFNVPPAAIRIPLQRRAGAHERVDLAFLWPSLEPPAVAPRTPGMAAPHAIDRVFVTIAAVDDTLPPAERARTIYPRYVATDVTERNGLVVQAFRSGSPYQGEDLIRDPLAPEGFLVRCSRSGAGPTLGICLYNRRVENADILVRFPRDWLLDWRAVEAGVGRLIDGLRAHGS